MYADKPKFCMCSFPHYLIQITCLEVILIATIKMHDEWEGLARMLADLITKYADVLEDQDKSNLSNEEEQQDAARSLVISFLIACFCFQSLVFLI